MARRQTPVIVQPEMTADQLRRGVARLKKRVTEIEEFDVNRIMTKHGDPETIRITNSIEEALTRTFEQGSVEYKRYQSAAGVYTGGIFMAGYDPDTIGDVRDYAKKSLDESKSTLCSAIAALEERLSEVSDESVSVVAAIGGDLKSAFIVHGHDGEAKEAVARFLSSLSIKPIILHEQASQGRTIIEKIEHHSDVGFAVVILTPDDSGAANGQEAKARARQNVILELGYFIGKLNRNRVCALVRSELEIPTDFGGVVYEKFDEAGAWKVALSKELSAAGFSIDWNTVMSR
ncbi:nucleotide-binding protein [Sphingomonas sp. GC_Shp_3]|uniref:nucleotide-binding protein n=1 Tax=Sphingomonas sp. GC_Shp_3 TaxID=2937383 RepID=UPI00226998BE|nr:nucleotide-binding protein [Sphingomonas sp. GC_Shp_3]